MNSIDKYPLSRHGKRVKLLRGYSIVALAGDKPRLCVKTTKRDKHTIRFMEWIRRYSGWQYLICTPGGKHMTPAMMKMLIERLSKEQFYKIIFVLLMAHRNADFADNAFKTLLLDMVLSGWKGEVVSRERFIRGITDLLT